MKQRSEKSDSLKSNLIPPRGENWQRGHKITTGVPANEMRH